MAYIPRSRFVLSRMDGAGELAYYVFGDPKAATRSCLAVHGVTSSSRAWQFFARILVEQHNVVVYAIDLRGRGDSNGIEGPFGMRAHAEDCIALMDHAQIGKVDWAVGHSMGAFVVAALTHLAPTRIAKTVFIDGGVPLPMPAGFTVETIMPLILGPALKRLAMTFASKEDYINYFRQQPAFHKGWGPEMDEYCTYDLHGVTPSTNPACVEQDTRDLFGESLVHDALTLIERDILMIRAERGLQNEPVPLYPEEYIKSVLAEKYPRIKLTTLPDTNHYDILLGTEGAAGCIALMMAQSE